MHFIVKNIHLIGFFNFFYIFTSVNDNVLEIKSIARNKRKKNTLTAMKRSTLQPINNCYRIKLFIFKKYNYEATEKILIIKKCWKKCSTIQINSSRGDDGHKLHNSKT